MSNIKDFEIENGVLEEYKGTDSEVTIPDSVTKIGLDAFRDCTSLTSITIPDSVTEIGIWAFEDCTSLTSITIPDSVTEIGSSAFWNCESLKSITIPDSVTAIGDGAFSGCTSLTSIIVDPDNSVYHSAGNCLIETKTGRLIWGTGNSIISDDGSVTSIGDGAFSGCTSLTSITIPDSVTKIGLDAFRDCTSLTSITIPDSVTAIGDEAFRRCSSLKSITIPDSVTAIGDEAFCGCISLKSITISDSVTKIGLDAFRGCRLLTSITIPDSVTEIGEGAFCDCSSLTSITIPDSVTAIGSYAFCDCSSLKSITIPDSVTAIGDEAFCGCTSLMSITIPNSVIKIGEDVVNQFIDSSVFHVRLMTPDQKIRGAVTFAEKYTAGENVGKELTDEWFAYIKKSKKRLYPVAAKNAALLRYMLENGIIPVLDVDAILEEKEISVEAKAMLIDYKENNITAKDIAKKEKAENREVELAFGAEKTPAELKKEWTYEENKQGITLTSYKGNDIDVVVPKAIEKNTVTEIAEYCFSTDKKRLKTDQKEFRKKIRSVTIPDSVTEIGSWAFSGCESLTSITIPDSVTAIGDSVFLGCKKLKSFTIPDSVTKIGKDAFNNTAWYNKQPNGLVYVGKIAYCYKGTMRNSISIALKEGTKRIAEGAFCGCTLLTSITIPDSVTVIGRSAFSRCESLTSITIPDSVTKIGDGAFYGCKKLADADGFVIQKGILFDYFGKGGSVRIPDGVTRIDGGAFFYSGATSIIIPDSVTKIVDYAFKNCKKLTSIAIPDGVTAIGERAFEDCKSLTSITIPESVTEIGYDAFSGCKLKSLTIHTHAGSYAEEYAKENKIPCVTE